MHQHIYSCLPKSQFLLSKNFYYPLYSEDNTGPSFGRLEINLAFYSLIYASGKCHRKEFRK